MAVVEVKSQDLKAADPELYDILNNERIRQWKGIELIASENFVSSAVLEALGSVFTNKYSEGYPAARYYGGNEFIDMCENLCMKRALSAFHLDSSKWGVNVQPLSGAPANLATLLGLLSPHDRIMGLDLPSGGHLTHGFYRIAKTGLHRVSASAVIFESLPYHIDSKTGLIDYDELERVAKTFGPKLIICGGSAYPREWDYERFRKIADSVNAILLCDMAHISGLVASQVVNSPFDHCHIVTSTTHKTLRGPRSGMIFYLLNPEYEFKKKINFGVFPCLQGGPHNHQIAALCTALNEVQRPEFKEYAKQVIANAKILADVLKKKNHKLMTDGTDNHLLLWDVRGLWIAEKCSITLNKNAVFGDASSFYPGGIRIGTPAMTTRGCKEKEMESIGNFLCRIADLTVLIAKGVKSDLSPKETFSSFKINIENYKKEIEEIKNQVEQFATGLFFPGVDPTLLKLPK